MSEKAHLTADKYVWFHCPGCKHDHGVPVEIGVKVDHRWQWNGSLEAPTLYPSLRVTLDKEGRQRHFFVTEGRIEFIPDSTAHQLRGFVDMLDWRGFGEYE